MSFVLVLLSISASLCLGATEADYGKLFTELNGGQLDSVKIITRVRDFLALTNKKYLFRHSRVTIQPTLVCLLGGRHTLPYQFFLEKVLDHRHRNVSFDK